MRKKIKSSCPALAKCSCSLGTVDGQQDIQVHLFVPTFLWSIIDNKIAWQMPPSLVASHSSTTSSSQGLEWNHKTCFLVSDVISSAPNFRVILYYITWMSVSRFREVKIFARKLKHWKKENQLNTMTLKMFREMVERSYRNPVRRGSSLATSGSSERGRSRPVRRTPSRLTRPEVQ